MRVLVATPAGDPCMFPFQPVSRTGVIKLLNRRTPMNQVEIPSIVLGVTLSAAPFGFVSSDQRRMQSSFGLKALANIPVATETLEFRRSFSCVVALCAVARPIQCSVGFRQFAG